MRAAREGSKIKNKIKIKSTAARAFLAGVFAPLLFPAAASACSVCMGANSKTGPASNGAIFLMLGFIGAVLSGVGAFAYNLAKRARAPLPPHAELSSTMTVQEDTK